MNDQEQEILLQLFIAAITGLSARPGQLHENVADGAMEIAQQGLEVLVRTRVEESRCPL